MACSSCNKKRSSAKKPVKTQKVNIKLKSSGNIKRGK